MPSCWGWRRGRRLRRLGIFENFTPSFLVWNGPNRLLLQVWLRYQYFYHVISKSVYFRWFCESNDEQHLISYFCQSTICFCNITSKESIFPHLPWGSLGCIRVAFSSFFSSGTCEFRISVGTVRPQPQAPDVSGNCWISASRPESMSDGMPEGMLE